MTIYVDVVLLENLCMNYIILFGTGYIIKLKMKHLRIFLSSVLGAIYAILAYAGILPMYANIFVKIILSLCMVYIAYNPKTIKGMLKELVVFYLVSFALGGCAFALLYIVRPQDIFMKDGVYIGTYPLKIALLGGITGFIITYIAFKAVKTRISKNEIIYKAAIKLDEKENLKVSQEELRMKLIELAKNKGKDIVKKMLADFGAEKLSDVKESSYNDLLAKIEEVM